jgi:hypothetical protein
MEGKNMSIEIAPRYLNEKQVATITGFAVQTLRNWRNRGIGPVYCKVNDRAVRYPWRDTLDFMDAYKIKPQHRAGQKINSEES